MSSSEKVLLSERTQGVDLVSSTFNGITAHGQVVPIIVQASVQFKTNHVLTYERSCRRFDNRLSDLGTRRECNTDHGTHSKHGRPFCDGALSFQHR